LEPPGAVWKWETEWGLEEINRGGSWQCRELEEILVALHCGDPVLWSGVTGN